MQQEKLNKLKVGTASIYCYSAYNKHIQKNGPVAFTRYMMIHQQYCKLEIFWFHDFFPLLPIQKIIWNEKITLFICIYPPTIFRHYLPVPIREMDGRSFRHLNLVLRIGCCCQTCSAERRRVPFGVLIFLGHSKFSGQGPALAAQVRERRNSSGMNSFWREGEKGPPYFFFSLSAGSSVFSLKAETFNILSSSVDTEGVLGW